MLSALSLIEHVLGDFLHGKLLLKHVVDWEAFVAKCKAFHFDRFVALIEALADVVEGKREYETLPDAYKVAFDEMLREQEPQSGQRSWFQRRVQLFFEIIRNSKKFRNYGYTSMYSFLFHSVWTHFFEREVRGI